MSRQNQQWLNYGFRYLVAALLIVFAVFPTFWVLSASLNPARSLMSASFFPENPTLNNYLALLNHELFPFEQWFLNSVKITFISVSLIVLITCLTGYALSRFRFRGKSHFMTAILIVNVFPAILSIVALFAIMQQLGTYIPWLGLDTHGGLILVYVAGAMSINVLMMKAYIDTIPMDLDESALVDGATHWQVFWHILFPMIRPIVVTIAILSLFAIYGDFVIARVLLQSTDNLTLMVGLMLFQRQGFNVDWGLITAGAVMAALPIVVLFLPLQNYVVGGLTSGAVKG
jgi:arabinogalactan oligomer/maltooligosaccharide transport system permease protein